MRFFGLVTGRRGGLSDVCCDAGNAPFSKSYQTGSVCNSNPDVPVQHQPAEQSQVDSLTAVAAGFPKQSCDPKDGNLWGLKGKPYLPVLDTHIDGQHFGSIPVLHERLESRGHDCLGISSVYVCVLRWYVG